MAKLYPEIAPHESGMLQTGDGHALYWERCGNPKGKPAVFLHGGPGGGTNSFQRKLFNPEKYDIVLFDQRGSGKSTPSASLENNTTAHLVEDIELLRRKLGIGSWLVCGGSWGSTLALSYAAKHPERVTALVMWGIFLTRAEELRDLYFEGGIASRVFPDAFAPFIELLPEAGRGDPVKGYKALFDTAKGAALIEAYDRWTRWEKKVSRLVMPDDELERQMADKAHTRAVALIENHYFLHNGFIDGATLLKTIGEKTRNIPMHIVQGRYDMVCPFITAWELHKAVKHSVLHVIDDAGHTAREPKLGATVVEILDGLAG